MSALQGKDKAPVGSKTAGIRPTSAIRRQPRPEPEEHDDAPRPPKAATDLGNRF